MKTNSKKLFLTVFTFMLFCGIAFARPSRPMPIFQKIKAGSGINVHYIQSNRPGIEITGNGRDQVTTEVRGNTLIIKRKSRNSRFNTQSYIKVNVYSPELDEVTVESGADFFSSKIENYRKFKITASGGGDVKIERLTTKGDMEIRTSGGADCNIKNLKARNCFLNASGGSDINISVKADGNAFIKASGGSDIRLSGKVYNLSVESSGGSDVYIQNLKYRNVQVRSSGSSDVFR